MRIVKLLQRFLHWLWNEDRQPLTPEEREALKIDEEADAKYW